MTTVALYARVSTRQHGQDPETQLVALREFAKQRNLTIVKEYVDHGWSPAKERRPALDRLMADARLKQFDAVLVWRFDRFARSVKQLISRLASTWLGRQARSSAGRGPSSTKRRSARRSPGAEVSERPRNAGVFHAAWSVDSARLNAPANPIARPLAI